MEHVHKKHELIHADGYTKLRGSHSKADKMIVEAQHQVRHLARNHDELAVFVRVGVAHDAGILRLDAVTENAIELSIDQARSLADWLRYEADYAEHVSRMANALASRR